MARWNVLASAVLFLARCPLSSHADAPSLSPAAALPPPLQLAVQLAEVCALSRGRNGGLISMSELVAALRARRARASGASAITSADVKQALASIAVLGNGFRIVELGGAEYVLSVPRELQQDDVALLGVAAQMAKGQRDAVAAAAAASSSSFASSSSSSSSSSASAAAALSPSSAPAAGAGEAAGGAVAQVGWLEEEEVVRTRGWERARVQRAVAALMQQSVCWVDRQAWRDPPAQQTPTATGPGSPGGAAGSAATVGAQGRGGGGGREAGRGGGAGERTKYWFPSLWAEFRAEQAASARGAPESEGEGDVAPADASPAAGL